MSVKRDGSKWLLLKSTDSKTALEDLVLGPNRPLRKGLPLPKGLFENRLFITKWAR
jgi:hypothetical protein